MSPRAFAALHAVDAPAARVGSGADGRRATTCGWRLHATGTPDPRATRETSGFDVREIGGPRGYERGYDRPMREYFAIICSKCGNAAQVPFKPRMDKPVYCSDCFREVQAV